MPATPLHELKAPHSLEAERALLGSILIDQDALQQVSPSVSRNDFFSEAHRIIYQKMLELAQAEHPIDIVTVVNALTEDNLLERVGGAAWVSSLTDGVPIGNVSAVKEYARIVAEHSRRRQAINLAQNMMARALEGVEDSQNIFDLAQKEIIEIAGESTNGNGRGKAEVVAAEAEAKRDEKPRVIYPDAPAEAWYGLTKIYLSAVEKTSQASHNYHLFSFYAALGALLGRSVHTFMVKRLYPSLFVVYVGSAGGARKGTAVRYATELATEVDPNTYVSIQIDSKESFIRELGPVQAGATDPETQQSLRVILELEEFRELADKTKQKGVKNIIPFLCKLYDCPAYVQVLTGEKAICKQPLLVINAAASQEYMESLTADELGGGLGRRLISVGGNPKPREDYEDPPPKDSEIYNAVKVRLREIVDTFRARMDESPHRDSTNLPLSVKAKKLWKHWFRFEMSPQCDDELISKLSEGDHVTCRQLALLNATLDVGCGSFNWEIEEEHLYAAVRAVNWLYESRFPIFAGHGMSPMARIDHRIIEFVRRQPRHRIMWKILRNRMQRPCPDQKIFNERMRALTADQDSALRIENLGHIRFVASND
ncbi:MAG: DnaB-like helicase N-terminal domain-containing protein [Candidatus Acidiferrales bacterium]